jgi:hypothetical protein
VAKVSLDDLRKGAPTARTERVYALCLRRDLMAEVDALSGELSSLALAQPEVDEENQPPKRKGQGGNPREKKIRDRLSILADEMEDATGDLRLRAIPDGEWRRWCNEHPARDDDQRDEQIGYGFCNTDDLANDLGMWAASWNGDDLAPDDWPTLFATNAAGGDLKALVSIVVMMQEAADDPKRLLRGLRGARSSSDSALSPAQ